MKLFKPTQIAEILAVRKLYVERAQWLQGKGIQQWQNVDDRYSVERLCHLSLDGNLWALEHEGKIIAATAIFVKDKMWEETHFVNKDVYYIHGLVSLKDHTLGAQMANPGKLLLKFIEAKALLAGKTHICLDCRKENEPLNAYYESFGFTERFTKVYSTGSVASLKAKYLRA